MQPVGPHLGVDGDQRVPYRLHVAEVPEFDGRGCHEASLRESVCVPSGEIPVLVGVGESFASALRHPQHVAQRLAQPLREEAEFLRVRLALVQ